MNTIDITINVNKNSTGKQSQSDVIDALIAATYPTPNTAQSYNKLKTIQNWTYGQFDEDILIKTLQETRVDMYLNDSMRVLWFEVARQYYRDEFINNTGLFKTLFFGC